MSVRPISFAEHEYYHVYNRGNSKQKIFHDREDYSRFIGLLYACNQKGNLKSDNLKKDEGLFSVLTQDPLVAIGAYCLMPNHFHILITQIEKAGLSRFMQKLTTAYVMYYNKKYAKIGSMFEGKFKAEHASTDRYLKYLFSYIHLNPVKLIDSKWKEKKIQNKQKILNYLNTYEDSSFLDYVNIKRIQNKILNTKKFPKYFPYKKVFLREIFDWLRYNDDSL
ncbi:MAG: transposase [bacterium]|nr:transposase [bacterium]